MGDIEPKPGSQIPLRWYQYRLRWLLLAPVIVGLFFGTGFGLVGLHYPRVLENDPLEAPVRVLSVQGDILRLEDGRVLRVTNMWRESSLAEAVAESDNRVDLVQEEGVTGLVLFGKQRLHIHGNSSFHIINIRLIPHDVPGNSREPLGVAVEEDKGAVGTGGSAN
jgi:hypothetical protein